MSRAVPLERVEQAHCVQLLRTLGGDVYVLGGHRAKGDRPSTMQTPGIPDVYAILPPHGDGQRQPLWLEVKRQKGSVVRPEQRRFAELCAQAGHWYVRGCLNDLIAALIARQYLKPDQVLHASLAEGVAMSASRLVMNTIGGRAIDPLAFRASDVSILDIAHALSHLCRFAGHVRTFYSVAQHAVLVSRAVPAADALHALLHDGSEAYLNDVIRPLKMTDALRGYRMVELRVQQTIYQACGLLPAEPESVRVADQLLLQAEMRDLCPGHRRHVDGAAWADPIIPVGPEQARTLFLDRYAELLEHRA